MAGKYFFIVYSYKTVIHVRYLDNCSTEKIKGFWDRMMTKAGICCRDWKYDTSTSRIKKTSTFAVESVTVSLSNHQPVFKWSQRTYAPNVFPIMEHEFGKEQICQDTEGDKLTCLNCKEVCWPAYNLARSLINGFTNTQRDVPTSRISSVRKFINWQLPIHPMEKVNIRKRCPNCAKFEKENSSNNTCVLCNVHLC